MAAKSAGKTLISRTGHDFFNLHNRKFPYVHCGFGSCPLPLYLFLTFVCTFIYFGLQMIGEGWWCQLSCKMINYLHVFGLTTKQIKKRTFILSWTLHLVTKILCLFAKYFFVFECLIQMKKNIETIANYHVI